MISLKLRSMPKNKRVMSEVFIINTCVCRFELTDNESYLVNNLKGN